MVCDDDEKRMGPERFDYGRRDDSECRIYGALCAVYGMELHPPLEEARHHVCRIPE
jgi:hypothetical protein